jgi:hypothetical protein
VELVETLWSLGHETSSRALTLKVSVFSFASKIRITSCSSSSWIFFILATFETKTIFFMLQVGRSG